MKLFTALLSVLILSALMATSASALPSTYQRFDAGVVGKAGTDAKPKAVQLRIHPFHEYGIAGGATNAGGLNSGATMENPFSTVYANVFTDKAIKYNLGSFPTCKLQTVFDDPDKCVKTSRVDIPSSATGLVRTKGALPGIYTLATVLEIKTFVLGKDTLGLRVVTPLATAVIVGKVSKATGAAAKKYGSRIRFTIPDGLIEPTGGLVSQLVDFNSGIKAVSSKGKPLVGLGKCPKSKKLNFGYNGEYTINATKNTDQISWKIMDVSSRIDKTVACK
jgi:hypothetical protein